MNKLTYDTYELCLKEQVQNNVFLCRVDLLQGDGSVRRARGALSWWFLRLGLLWALEAGMEK